MHTRQGYLSSYYFSPEDITTAGLNQMWALRTDEVVQTTSICKHRNTEPDGGGPVLVSAMVRTCDPQEAAASAQGAVQSCPLVAARYPVAVESGGYSMRQLDARDVLQVLRIQDRQLATIGRPVIHITHQHAVVFGRIGR